MKHFLLRLEWDESVESYFQPLMELSVDHSGFEYCAAIDLWVNRTDGEVVLVHFLNSYDETLCEHQPLLNARMSVFCTLNNFHYSAVGPKNLDNLVLHSNLELLWRYATSQVTAGQQVLVNTFFTQEKFPTAGKMRNYLKRHGFSADLVYSFIFHRLVLCDIGHFYLTHETHIQSSGKYPVVLLRDEAKKLPLNEGITAAKIQNIF
jgi:hypothetical protein